MSCRGNTAGETGQPGTTGGNEAAKRRSGVSASILRRPPAAGNAETLRMIAPGPDDRNRIAWWTFGSNRLAGAKFGELSGEPGGATGKGEALSGGSTGTVRWEKCLRADRTEQARRWKCFRAGRAWRAKRRSLSGGWNGASAKLEVPSGGSSRACEARNVFGRSERSEIAEFLGSSDQRDEAKSRNLAPSSDSTDVASRRNQMARADLRESQAN